jgi:SPP1 gp7 family putative phage head morphogenesis protein
MAHLQMALNDELLDASVAHSIDQTGYGNHVVRRMLTILRKTDIDLFAKLEIALEKIPANTLNIARLEKILIEVRELNTKAYNQIYGEMAVEMEKLTEYEAEYQLSLFKSLPPVELSLTAINAGQVYAAAMSRPFQGRILRDWASSLEADRLQRIKDAIAIGYVENETIAQTVKRIKGTKALNYKDGLLEVDRRHLEAVVRTAVNHIANFSRNAFMNENADLLRGYRYTAVIDGRTSLICSSRDGNVYGIDKTKPSLPAHFNCRSVYVPVVKSFKELGFDTEELPASTRSSMNGQIPDDITYEAWLKKRPASFQDEVLGATKGKLFRTGEIKLDRFVSRQGHIYSLDELRKRDASAFTKAGL